MSSSRTAARQEARSAARAAIYYDELPVGALTRAQRRAKPAPVGTPAPRANRSDARPASTQRAKRIRARRRAERDARSSTRAAA